MAIKPFRLNSSDEISDQRTAGVLAFHRQRLIRDVFHVVALYEMALVTTNLVRWQHFDRTLDDTLHE